MTINTRVIIITVLVTAVLLGWFNRYQLVPTGKTSAVAINRLTGEIIFVTPHGIRSLEYTSGYEP